MKIDVLVRLQNAIHAESATLAPQTSEPIEAMRAAQEEIRMLREILNGVEDRLDEAMGMLARVEL